MGTIEPKGPWLFLSSRPAKAPARSGFRHQAPHLITKAIALACFIVPSFILPTASRAQTVAIEKIARGDIEHLVRGCPETNVLRLEKLESYFRDFGCPSDRIAKQPVKGSKEPNLIVSLPGLSDSAILVGAHFDFSTRAMGPFADWSDSPLLKGKGVIDDWSGAILLPVFYGSLRTRPRQHTFIFIAFAAEEVGLKGSKSYVAQMTPQEAAKAKAFIDLDCLGLDTTAVWAKRADPILWEYMKQAAAVTELPLRGVNMPSAFHFDTESFNKYKIPTMIIHSANQGSVFTPHSFLDTVFSMHWKQYYDSYLLIGAFLGYIDLKLK